jgi:hypothetical protein
LHLKEIPSMFFPNAEFKQKQIHVKEYQGNEQQRAGQSEVVQ